jgi:alpha-tubulin suppressor-like RCC1 family protein
MGRVLLAAALLVAAVLPPGCYAPAYVACQIRCGAGDACPSGQECGDDGYCHGRAGEMCLPTFAQVAVGTRHTCATRSDGTLWCWGANASGQVGDGSAKPRATPVQVGEDADWQQVAAGDDYTCGIRADSSLWCWGDLATTKVFAPEPADAGQWARLVVSGARRCGITTGGELWCSDAIEQPMERVGLDADWLDVGMGTGFRCGLRAPGSLWCWGRATHGEFGDGDPNDHTVADPQRSGEQEDFVALSSGWSHTCGVTAGGALLCWGNGYKTGALGNAMPPTSVATPTPVGAASGWATVSAGAVGTCGTTTDGELRCWGVGLVGDGTSALRETPVAVAPGRSWQAVALGSGHGCAVSQDGSVWCWGDNDSGQLGHGAIGAKAAPTQVGAESTWQAVAAGGYHACATRQDGSLACFGLNTSGQLGDDSDQAAVVPVEVPADPPWTTVAAGDHHTCGVRTDGSAWCWGKNDLGAVGDKTNLDKLGPTQVEPATDWQTLALGPDVSCGWRGDRSAWCWGAEALSAPRRVDGEWLAVSQLDGQACGLSPTGAVLCDGLPGDSFDVLVAEDAAWAAIAGNNYRGCALSAAGALTCWGSNAYGQLGIGVDGGADYPPTEIEPGSTWSQIVVASWYKCGIRTDRTLWCWGGIDVPTSQGVVSRPSSPTQVEGNADWLAIAAGTLTTTQTWSYTPFLCGIRDPGTLWCWGSNRFGQLGDGSGGRLAPVPVMN